MQARLRSAGFPGFDFKSSSLYDRVSNIVTPSCSNPSLLSIAPLLPTEFSATLRFYEDLKPVHLPLHGLGAASNASGQRPPFRIRYFQGLGWKPLSGGYEDDQSCRSWLHNSAGGGKSGEEGWRELAVRY